MHEPDSKDTSRQDAASTASDPAEAKRIAARRRFLRMGAGGSAAMMVTVVHKRAFAGVKKGSVVSNCISMGGTPDIKGMDKKKALQVSAGGTLKNTTCYKAPNNPPPINTCASPGNPVPVYGFVQSAKGGWHVRALGTVPAFSDKQMQSGCGSLEGPPSNPGGPGMLSDPFKYQYNWRLYKKFYCPVKIEGGVIDYYPPGTGTKNLYNFGPAPSSLPAKWQGSWGKLIKSDGTAVDPCADPQIQ